MSIQKHFTRANVIKSYKNAPSNLKATAKVAPGVISRAGKNVVAKGKYLLAGGAYGASFNATATSRDLHDAIKDAIKAKLKK
jgi:hypothetical protein